MKHPAKAPTPAQIEASIVRLQRGTDHYRDVPWPGGGALVRVRLLSRTERQLRFADALARFKAIGIDLVDLDTREEFAAEQITGVLAHAVCDPAKPIPGTKTMCEPYFLAIASELGCDLETAARDTLTDDENAALWDVYLGLERDTNPKAGGGITAEVIALVAEAQKKRAPDLLKALAPYTLRSLLASTDSLQSISPSGRSGSGEPHETPP